MNITKINCQNCSARLKVPAGDVGKRYRCPSCGTISQPRSVPSVTPATQRPWLSALFAFLALATVGAGLMYWSFAVNSREFESVSGYEGDQAIANRVSPVATQPATGGSRHGESKSPKATESGESATVQSVASVPRIPTRPVISAESRPLASTQSSESSEMPVPQQAVVFIAEGVGTDAENARKDACRNAVRQAVGAYVDSETIAENDELITDRVVVLSAAFVDKVEPIAGSERSENGLIRVRVRAHVKVTKLLDELAAGKVGTRAVSSKVDTASLVAELTTKTDQHEAREKLLTKLFSDYPESCLTLSQVSKEAIDKSPDGRTYLRLSLSITPNKAAYEAFSKALCEALSVTERVSGTFRVDGERLSSGNSANPEDATQRRNQFRSAATAAVIREVFSGSNVLAGSVDARGHSPFIDFGPVYLFSEGAIDDAYEKTFNMWGALRDAPDTDRYIACMTACQKNYRQTTWRWFRVTEKEYKAWFGNTPDGVVCKIQLLDSQGAALVDDIFTLRRIGVGRPNRFELGVWCAPFFLDNEDWYTPELRFIHLVEVDDEDIPRIVRISLSLERAAAPRQ